jgi:O-glycosyl hydrolase
VCFGSLIEEGLFMINTVSSKIRQSSFLISVFVLLAAALMPAIHVHAANVNVTVDGNSKSQTMDGFGVSINAHSWKNGQLKPALDMLVDQNGSNTFRIVQEMADWEATNDDANANNYNWNYYDPIYSGATTYDTAQAGSNFADLWNTIDYLHQKGIPDSGIILSFMGPGPSWNGGINVSSAQTDEWAEMVTSAAYYGYSHGHTFGNFAPNNEMDWGHNEGITMTAAVNAAAMNKVATRLDALGLTSMRLVVPEVAQTCNGITYWNQLANFPNVMAKVDHMALHDYSGGTCSALGSLQGSAYPTKNLWMSEFSIFDQAFPLLDQGASGLLMWDGYESVYNHGIVNGLGSSPGNDAGNAPALIAYNQSTGVYTPRKSMYQFGQLFKYVPKGSVKIGTSRSGGTGYTYAFYDQSSGRVTIMGQNTGTGSDTITTNLTNLPPVSSFQYYQTNSTQNMQRGTDVAVTGSSFTFTVPANTIYTLTSTSAPDTTAPAINITAPANNATVSGSTTVSANASDNVGVLGVQFKVDGTNVGSEDTTSPYSITWNSAAVTNGSHTITAVARDAAGNSTTSTSVSVTVSNVADTTLPTVNLTAPTAGTTVSGSSVALSANAADNIGVAGVQFKVDGTNVGSEDTTSPYSFNWDSTSVADGDHAITAVARDGAGNTATSNSVTITVKNAAATGTLILGNQTIQATSDSNTAGSAEAFKYVAAASGTAGNISFYVDSGTTATSLKVGVYSDNAGHPGTLLASVSVNSIAQSSWNNATLSPAVQLNSGTAYWIAFLGVGGGINYKDAATGSCSESFATAGQTNLPSSWVSGQSWPSCTISAYVLAASTGPKSGDINGDNSVNITDLSFLLSSYGQNTTQCVTNNAFKCDLSSPGDGIVNIFDLSILLSNYGK